MKEFFTVVQWTEYEGDTKVYFFDIHKAIDLYSKRQIVEIAEKALI